MAKVPFGAHIHRGSRQVCREPFCLGPAEYFRETGPGHDAYLAGQRLYYCATHATNARNPEEIRVRGQVAWTEMRRIDREGP